MHIHLVREQTSDEGTFAALYVRDHIFKTVELPWRNNERNISCIPCGSYECSIVDSPRFGKVYQVHDVPNRTHILFHAGNWAGDRSLNLRSNSDGCILVGERIVSIYNQLAVSESRKALNRFTEILENEPFTLVVAKYDL